jgi:hypothetical protein
MTLAALHCCMRIECKQLPSKCTRTGDFTRRRTTELLCWALRTCPAARWLTWAPTSTHVCQHGLVGRVFYLVLSGRVGGNVTTAARQQAPAENWTLREEQSHHDGCSTWSPSRIALLLLCAGSAGNKLYGVQIKGSCGCLPRTPRLNCAGNTENS